MNGHRSLNDLEGRVFFGIAACHEFKRIHYAQLSLTKTFRLGTCSREHILAIGALRLSLLVVYTHGPFPLH